MSNKCTKEKLDQMKKVGDQAQTLVKSVNKLSTQLTEINKKRLENEQYLALGKHGPWYSKVAERQAKKEAEKKVARMIKNYQVDVSKLRRNINYLQALLHYNEQSTDLFNFYTEQINSAEQKIKELHGQTNVANRLSTFYHKKDDNTSPWNYYLRIIYWIVFSVISVLFLKKLYRSYKGGHIASALIPGLPIIALFIFLPILIIPLLKLIKRIFFPTCRH